VEIISKDGNGRRRTAEPLRLVTSCPISHKYMVVESGAGFPRVENKVIDGRKNRREREERGARDRER